MFVIKLRDGNGKLTSEKLHSYWDGGIGDFPKTGANFAPPPLDEIPPVAVRLSAEFPDSDSAWKDGGTANFDGWAKESSQDAQDFAYKGIAPNKPPSTEYNTAALKTVHQRVVWGGYRLADLLNSIWP